MRQGASETLLPEQIAANRSRPFRPAERSFPYRRRAPEIFGRPSSFRFRSGRFAVPCSPERHGSSLSGPPDPSPVRSAGASTGRSREGLSATFPLRGGSRGFSGNSSRTVPCRGVLPQFPLREIFRKVSVPKRFVCVRRRSAARVSALSCGKRAGLGRAGRHRISVAEDILAHLLCFFP